MKKYIVLGLTLMLTAVMTTATSAALPLRVVVNNTKVTFPDAQPYVDEQNRVQVPVRFVTEALGAEVTWNASSQVVTMKREGKIVTMKIGEKYLTVNGQKKSLDTKALLLFKRTFVPARFVSEAFGAKVVWDERVMTAYINTTADKEAEPVDPEVTGETKYYSGIPFNPSKDVAKDGRMKIDKAQEFMLLLLEQIQFYQENGKCYMKVTYPELPEGYKYQLGLFVDRTGERSNIYFNNNDFGRKEIVIPATGSFTQVLDDMKSPKEISFIEVQCFIMALDGPGTNGEKYEGYIYAYSKNFEEDRVGIVLRVDPFNTRYLRYDFNKLFKW